MIESNRFAIEKDLENEDAAEWLISFMTISMSDSQDDSNPLPFLFKDPSEDGSIVIEYYPSFVTFNFVSMHYSFQIEEKLKDPFLNIFSPPPQLL